MNYLTEIALLVINLVMAWWHSRLILGGRPIKHGLWALLYAACLGAAFWITRNPLVPIAGVFIRECFFAPVLNFLRKPSKPFFYRSSTSTSILDQVQGAVYVPVYIVSWLALIILQLYLHG